jgi:type I restriction enzyme, R subunit
LLHELQEQIGKDLDPFDLICHIAYDQPALTRRQRAKKVQTSSYRNQYSEQARQVINYLLDMYADQGVTEIQKVEILKVSPLNRMGTSLEIVNDIF